MKRQPTKKKTGICNKYKQKRDSYPKYKELSQVIIKKILKKIEKSAKDSVITNSHSTQEEVLSLLTREMQIKLQGDTSTLLLY